MPKVNGVERIRILETLVTRQELSKNTDGSFDVKEINT